MTHCQKKRKQKTLIVYFFQAGATTPRWAVEFWKPSADAFKKNNPDCTVRADYLQMLLRLVDKKKDLAQYFINLIFHCYRINLNDVFYPLYIKSNKLTSGEYKWHLREKIGTKFTEPLQFWYTTNISWYCNFYHLILESNVKSKHENYGKSSRNFSKKY